jgi:hypothetical protein
VLRMDVLRCLDKEVCMPKQQQSAMRHFFLSLFALGGIVWFGAGALSAQPAVADCARDFLPADEHPRFFPVDPDEFGPNGDVAVGRYSCILRAMSEFPLLEEEQKTGAEAFRLIVVPVFRPSFVVMLIIAPDGSGRLTARSSEDWRNAATLTLDRTTTVTKEGVGRFLRLVHSEGFWSMQTNQFYTKDEVIRARNSHTKRKKAAQSITGGVEWVLEGARGTDYHVVARTSPEIGPYTELTSYLFTDLANLKIPEYVEPLPRKK